MVEGRINPTSTPVTAALPSPKSPFGLMGCLRKSISVTIAVRVLSRTTHKARIPKKITPAARAGMSE